VLLEGWDQFELDAIATEVAGLLDGRAPVSELLASLPYDPFFVKKAISDLVLQGLARPLLVQEMEDLARAAIDERRNVDAIAYLTRALKSERNHRGLREQLAELLAAEGRHADAAAEYATLGFDVARDGDPDGALALYEKAVRLAPADLPLHERRVQLLAEVGDAETHLQAVFALANVMLDMALADRARQVLEAARGRRELKHRVDLVTKLAEVELALGRRSEAADLFTEAAERCVQTDRPQALSWLVRATECRPDDESLRRRYLELESGERERRRVRLRRRVGIAAVFAVLLAGATAGVVEILASNAVVSALASSKSSGGIR
jgi:tetratricopeptide (TPR) repeat protein